MRRTVWKYEIDPYLDQMPKVIPMPKGAKLLYTAPQFSHNPAGELSICVWAEVDEDETEMVDRAFFVVGTGHPIPPEAFVNGYVGTVQVGMYVWHTYEMPAEARKNYVREGR